MAEEEPEDREQRGVSVVGTTPRRPAGPSARDRARRRGSRRSAGEDRSAEDERGADDAGEDAADRSGADAFEERDLGDDDVDEGDLDEDEALDRGRRWVPRHSISGRRRTVRRMRQLPTAAVVGLGALAVVGTLSGVGFGLAWANLNAQSSQREAVKQSATTFLKDLTNFQPNTVDADFAAVQNWAANGSVFAKQAAQTFNSNIRQALVQAKATSQGQVRNLYVEDVNGSKGQVYAVIDQSYQNAKMTAPATDVLRVTLDMTSTSQGWRVAAVTVENPSGTPSAPATPAGR